VIPAKVSTEEEGTRQYTTDLVQANSCELLPDLQIITTSVQLFHCMQSAKCLTHESVLSRSILKMLLECSAKNSMAERLGIWHILIPSTIDPPRLLLVLWPEAVVPDKDVESWTELCDYLSSPPRSFDLFFSFSLACAARATSS
jgi:hypothetical protein